VINPLVQAFPFPALRKEREERGTHFIADASENQKPGPPASIVTGTVTALVTYFLPPQWGGGSASGAAAGFVVGTAVQSVQNYVEGGLRAQASLIGCNASQGMVDSIQ